MKMNDFAKAAIAYRRQKRDLTKRGYEQISCAFGIGDLWQLDRGFRYDWRLTDCILGVDGKSVFVKAEPPR